MALNIENNKGIAFYNDKGLERSEKAPSFKGEIMLEGKRIEIAIWERKTKAGKKMLSMAVEDAHSAQIERAEKTLEYLRNKSEKPESRDELAEKPDTTEKAVPSNKRRKVA